MMHLFDGTAVQYSAVQYSVVYLRTCDVRAVLLGRGGGDGSCSTALTGHIRGYSTGYVLLHMK
jgi:hypothetical protein